MYSNVISFFTCLIGLLGLVGVGYVLVIVTKPRTLKQRLIILESCVKPFRAFSYCEFCGKLMTVETVYKKNGSRGVLFLRCMTKGCERFALPKGIPRQVRGNIIVAFVKEFIKKRLILTSKRFAKLVDGFQIGLVERLASLEQKLRTTEEEITKLVAEKRGITRAIGEKVGTMDDLSKINSEIEEKEKEKKMLLISHKKLKEDEETGVISFEEYSNMLKTIQESLQSVDSDYEVDSAVKYIFSNLYLGAGKVTGFELKPKFSMFGNEGKNVWGQFLNLRIEFKVNIDNIPLSLSLL